MFSGIIQKGETKKFLWNEFTLNVTQNSTNELFTVSVTYEHLFHISGYQLWNAASVTNYNRCGTGTIEVAQNIGYGSVPCNRLKLLIWTGAVGEHYEITIYTNKKTKYLYITVQYCSVDDFGVIQNKFLSLSEVTDSGK